MDPITDLQATATTEPAAHIAHAANPTPSHGPYHNHPSYAEMITAAIAALKEKNGSSRHAIAKYIDKEYTDLPPTHSSLLTHNLKRLKNNGHLVMVKHSYKLPGSGPLHHPPLPTTDFPTTTAVDASSEPKRRPGRPPKPRPDVQLQPIISVAGPEAQAYSVVGPEPMFVSLGLADELPPPAVVKRGRGRPTKPKLLSVLMGNGGPKKGRGRPPRTGPVAVTVPLSGSVPRPRGQPKIGAYSRPKPTGKPRGRPPKNAAANGGGGGLVMPIDGIGGGVSPARRPGRPPKSGVAKKPRKLTGKTLGRPKKGGPGTAVLVTDPQQLVAYQDLKTKLEYFQSKIKQAASVLKPYINPESGIHALVTLQELEVLATMDVTAPLHVQGHAHEQPQPLL